MRYIGSIFLLLFFFPFFSRASRKFEVLEMTDLPVFAYDEYAATFSAIHSEPISEFTFCLRFLIRTYNDGLLYLFNSLNVTNGNEILKEHFGYTEEMTSEYQAGLTLFKRVNVPGGGLGNQAFPIFHNFEWAKTVKISKWYHYCLSYSSILHQIRLFQDGLKVYSFVYQDEIEDPLPSNTFEKVVIGSNFPGLMTDVNIYSTFFKEEDIIKISSGCEELQGDIFGWDTDKLSMIEESNMVTKIITMDSQEICLDQSQPVPERTPTDSVRVHKQAKLNLNATHVSYADLHLEYIGDKSWHTNMEAIEGCKRLNGELTTVPQNEEEEKLLVKTMRDVLITHLGPNQTHFDGQEFALGVTVIGETQVLNDGITQTKLEEMGLSDRDQTYPPNGELELMNPLTGAPLKRTRIVNPQVRSYDKFPLRCLLCYLRITTTITCNDYPGRAPKLRRLCLCFQN